MSEFAHAVITIEGDVYNAAYVVAILLYADSDEFAIIVHGKPEPIRYICKDATEARESHAAAVKQWKQALLIPDP